MVKFVFVFIWLRVEEGSGERLLILVDATVLQLGGGGV